MELPKGESLTPKAFTSWIETFGQVVDANVGFAVTHINDTNLTIHARLNEKGVVFRYDTGIKRLLVQHIAEPYDLADLASDRWQYEKKTDVSKPSYETLESPMLDTGKEYVRISFVRTGRGIPQVMRALIPKSS